MRRAAPFESCACEACSPARRQLDRFSLVAGAVAFALVPGRALLHLVGIL